MEGRAGRIGQRWRGGPRGEREGTGRPGSVSMNVCKHWKLRQSQSLHLSARYNRHRPLRRANPRRNAPHDALAQDPSSSPRPVGCVLHAHAATMRSSRREDAALKFANKQTNKKTNKQTNK
jgi:hypothetical protein